MRCIIDEFFRDGNRWCRWTFCRGCADHWNTQRQRFRHHHAALSDAESREISAQPRAGGWRKQHLHLDSNKYQHDAGLRGTLAGPTAR